MRAKLLLYLCSWRRILCQNYLLRQRSRLLFKRAGSGLKDVTAKKISLTLSCAFILVFLRILVSKIQSRKSALLIRKVDIFSLLFNEKDSIRLVGIDSWRKGFSSWLSAKWCVYSEIFAVNNARSHLLNDFAIPKQHFPSCFIS